MTEKENNADSIPGQSHMSYAGFAALLVGAMIGGLTQTGMNTTLPSVTVDLGISVTLAQWLTTIFPLCLGIVMPTVAFLSRRFSVRVLYLTSMTIFVAGTVLVYVSATFPQLLLGRIFQGVATGISVPLIQIVVLTQFPRSKIGTLMGFVGLAMGFAPSIGPTIAGAFTTAFGWRSVFIFLGAFAVLIIIATLLFIHDRTPDRSKATAMDMPSLACSTLGFGGLLLGFSNASSVGWTNAATLLPLVVGAVFLVVFTRRELRIPNPLLSMKVFRTRDFTVSTLMMCCLFVAFIGVTLVIPLYVQGIVGESALVSGMVLLPGTISAAVISPLSGWLMDRFGIRPIALGGSLVFLVGSVALLHLGSVTDMTYLACWQFVRTAGQSILIMPVTTWGLNALPRSISADGTSMTNAIRQVAASLGTAVMVMLMSWGEASGGITADGVNAAMTFSVLMSVALLAMAFIFIKKPQAK